MYTQSQLHGLYLFFRLNMALNSAKHSTYNMVGLLIMLLTMKKKFTL